MWVLAPPGYFETACQLTHLPNCSPVPYSGQEMTAPATPPKCIWLRGGYMWVLAHSSELHVISLTCQTAAQCHTAARR